MQIGMGNISRTIISITALTCAVFAQVFYGWYIYLDGINDAFFTDVRYALNALAFFWSFLTISALAYRFLSGKAQGVAVIVSVIQIVVSALSAIMALSFD